MAREFEGKTVLITGASRGIGLAIGKTLGSLGANVVVAAKSATAHSKLPGTIFSAAREIEEAGGKALAVQCDIQDEEQVKAAVAATVKAFGGIDILVNNASAISLTGTLYTPIKKYDLMNRVNARGTFLVTQAVLPELLKSAAAGRNPHVLAMSPPLKMDPRWLHACGVAYTMAKYGMSMCVLGMAEEFKKEGIAFNALWPRTAIRTAALQMIPGANLGGSRSEAIIADAALWIFRQPSSLTGNFFMDEEVHQRAGMTLEEVGTKYNDAGVKNEEMGNEFFVGEAALYFTEFTKPTSKL